MNDYYNDPPEPDEAPKWYQEIEEAICDLEDARHSSDVIRVLRKLLDLTADLVIAHDNKAEADALAGMYEEVMTLEQKTRFEEDFRAINNLL